MRLKGTSLSRELQDMGFEPQIKQVLDEAAMRRGVFLAPTFWCCSVLVDSREENLLTGYRSVLIKSRKKIQEL